MNGFVGFGAVALGFVVILVFGLACSWSITQIYRFSRIRRVVKKTAVDPRHITESDFS